MPEAAPTLPGAPCWIEIFTSEPGQAEDFYCRLFGWTADHAGGAYVNFYSDGNLVAGCMRNDGKSGAPDSWSVYLTTSDIQTTAEAASAHGGQVMVPPTEVVDKGRFAILADVGRAAIGAWQPGSQKGFDVVGSPGAPSWFELLTRDYAASVEFYQDVFDWDTHVAGDTDALRYTTLSDGDTAMAGIMDATSFLPGGAPASWCVYFCVKDCDATIAKAQELGGSVVMAAEDSPFGRLAQLADRSGVTFKIVQPA